MQMMDSRPYYQNVRATVNRYLFAFSSM